MRRTFVRREYICCVLLTGGLPAWGSALILVLIGVRLSTVLLHLPRRVSPLKAEDEYLAPWHGGAVLHTGALRQMVREPGRSSAVSESGDACGRGQIVPTERDMFQASDFVAGPSVYTVTDQFIKPVTNRSRADELGIAEASGWRKLQHFRHSLLGRRDL